MSCHDIGKVFDNGKRALSGVNFSIPTKGIFALIGRNGAGKTTLTRILSTLLEPSSGRATIDGLDVMADAKKLRERTAVVPQEGRTVHWMTPKQSVSSYLMWRGLGYRESRRQADEALARVGIGDYADKLNRTLSGGMKRKVLVSMVIASQADFIFLDEPTTGLDPISRRELWDLLTGLSRERFLFLTTHYLEEAEQIADRIGVLDGGELLALGSMDELRRQVQHQYSLKVRKGAELPAVQGELVERKDGWVQLMTTEEEAMGIAQRLLEQKTQFSVNPVELDDIFSYIVKGSIQNGEERGDGD